LHLETKVALNKYVFIIGPTAMDMSNIFYRVMEKSEDTNYHFSEQQEMTAVVYAEMYLIQHIILLLPMTSFLT
jgi:hypothetical protein